MNDSMRYPVNDCYACVQGEGVHTGMAMVLLRLQGCSVGCSWCDTKETWTMDEKTRVSDLSKALGTNPEYICLSAEEIVNHIVRNHPGPQWILVTGGEPAQYVLKPLVAEFKKHNYKLALETSGTETGHLNAGFDWICVSPKLNMPGGKTVKPEVLIGADEIKQVVAGQGDIEALDKLLTKIKLDIETHICLQPVSLNEKATRLCVETVLARGWRLSLQMHKYIGVR